MSAGSQPSCEKINDLGVDEGINLQPLALQGSCQSTGEMRDEGNGRSRPLQSNLTTRPWPLTMVRRRLLSEVASTVILPMLVLELLLSLLLLLRRRQRPPELLLLSSLVLLPLRAVTGSDLLWRENTNRQRTYHTRELDGRITATEEGGPADAKGFECAP